MEGKIRENHRSKIPQKRREENGFLSGCKPDNKSSYISKEGFSTLGEQEHADGKGRILA